MTGLFLVVSFLLGFGLSWLYMVRSVTRTMPASTRRAESAATRYYRRKGATATTPPDEDDLADEGDLDGADERDTPGGATRHH